jgi:hypothetical protein
MSLANNSLFVKKFMHMALKLITITLTEVTYFGKKKCFYSKKLCCMYLPIVFPAYFTTNNFPLKFQQALYYISRDKHIQVKFHMVLADPEQMNLGKGSLSGRNKTSVSCNGHMRLDKMPN